MEKFFVQLRKDSKSKENSHGWSFGKILEGRSSTALCARGHGIDI